MSHHRRQLPLRDVETKVDLARRAVQENLTVVQLEAEIAEHRKAESAGKPRGRRPLPPLVKAVGRLPKVVEEIVSVQLTEATVHAVGEDQAPELVQTISQQITELAEMQERLTRSLQGRAPMRGDAAIIKDLGEA